MGGMGGGGCYSSTGYQETPNAYSSPAPPPHVFPAMSVNVSMNMTMGVSNVNMGYSPDQSLQHQVRLNSLLLTLHLLSSVLLTLAPGDSDLPGLSTFYLFTL